VEASGPARGQREACKNNEHSLAKGVDDDEREGEEQPRDIELLTRGFCDGSLKGIMSMMVLISRANL
jgi:hypothetical protein